MLQPPKLALDLLLWKDTLKIYMLLCYVHLSIIFTGGGGGICIQRWISCSSIQKHGKRMFFQGKACTAWKKDVFQGEARTARAVFRVSKTAKIKKKGMFFKASKKYKIRVCFLPTTNMGLGYDFEPMSLIRV